MNPNNYQKGDRVSFTKRDSTQPLTGSYSHHAPNGSAYIKGDDGQSYERKYTSIRKIADAQTDFQTSNVNSIEVTPPVQFDINQRFEFLQQLVRMVLKGTSVSMIITGEGGLGKSFTVKREIDRRQLVKNQDFVYIKGYSTPRGLYRTLFEHNGKVIVFDDCDEVLIDNIAKNLLKGALDSYDEREIHWITKSTDESLPDSFVFTGRVIFISNKSQSSIDNALLTRSMCIDLTMSRENKMQRMEWIVENSKDFMPHVPKEDKVESLELIRDNINNVKELSLRSLEKVVKVKTGEHDLFNYDDTDGMVKTDWKTLAKYMLVN